MIPAMLVRRSLAPVSSATRGGRLNAAWFVAIVFITASHSRAEEPAGSLAEPFAKAAELAKGPETAAAIAEYQKTIDIHLANEALYRQAVRRVVDLYRQADREEDGIRYLFSVVRREDPEAGLNATRDMIQEFAIRSPQAFQKVAVEMGLADQPRSRLTVPAAADDLRIAILQRRDQGLRDAALVKLRALLAAASPDAEQARALATLAAVMSARFDRAPFRALVVPLLKSASPEVRSLALGCLGGLEAQPTDLAAIVPLADDPDPRVRMAVAGALVTIGAGREAETVAPALVKLLSDSDPQVIEPSLRALWGQYSTPALDERLIALSRLPAYHHNAIYFGLSTQRNKSRSVCQRLVDELDDADWNNSGRAAWGLTYGVADEAKPVVEAGLLKALPEETNPYTRKQEFRALAGVATKASREYLSKVVESAAENDEDKAAADKILKSLGQ
ncbi:MAG TPA: HEAT repeat domain-containing protein [Pirellulales bacterium]